MPKLKLPSCIALRRTCRRSIAQIFNFRRKSSVINEPTFWTTIVAVATILALSGCASHEHANSPQDSTRGGAIYAYSCAGCHDQGVGGAPRLDDRAAWATRAPEWSAVLENHAINGFVKMPPRGGYRHLRPDDVTLAVGFMRKQLGSTAVADLSQAAVLGRQVYIFGCANCHDRGINGAPIIGDSKDWATRTPNWTAVLTTHAVNGFVAMEPKGGYGGPSDEDVSLAVSYMVSKVRDR